MCVCEMTDVRLEEAVTVCVYVPLLTMMTTTALVVMEQFFRRSLTPATIEQVCHSLSHSRLIFDVAHCISLASTN